MASEVLGYSEAAIEHLTTGIPGPAGRDGPPGGVTNWLGAWLTATDYDPNDGVSNGGVDYFATASHTSGASTEPGVGVNWETVWRVTDGSRAETARTAAEAAATAAGISETNAETAASAASDAQTAAEDAATNAATSEDNADTSETNAATSASAASDAQTAAEDAASAAAASEVAAETARADAEIFAGIDPYYSTNGDSGDLPVLAPGGGAIPDLTLGRYIDGNGDYQAARWNAGGGTWDDVGDPVPSSTHSHANKALLDLITNAGSGAIITNIERNKLRDVASQVEAETATNNVTAMTPLRTKQQADARGVMLKSVYDGDADGRVEAADQLSDGTNIVTAEQGRNHLDDATIHRTINDSGTGATDLWSAQKIGNRLDAKASPSDVRFPTTDQKAALAGTQGTPSDANRYVTNEDPRLTGSGSTVLWAWKTSAENRNASGFSDDAALFLALEASSVYLVECDIFCTISTMGIDVGLSGPSGATGSWTAMLTGQQTDTELNRSFNTTSYNLASGGSNQKVLLTIRGQITTTTAGNITFRWDGGGLTTLQANSIIKVTKQ